MRSIGDQLMFSEGAASVAEECDAELNFLRRKTTNLTLSMIDDWYSEVLKSIYDSRMKAKLRKKVCVFPKTFLTVH